MNITPLLRGVIWLALLGLGASSVGCASDKAVISQANQAHTGLKPAVIEEAVLSGYIQQVGNRIIDAARELSQQGYGPRGSEDNAWMFSKDMRFHFVNSKTLNAFTTGGEHMYIYTGLFQQCKTEDELAAVMAHEFAHIYGRHVHKGMTRRNWILAGAGAAGAAGYALGAKDDKGLQYAGMGAGVGLLAGQFVGMNYTRGDEDEADKLGFTFYTRGGWDPARFGDFFQTMVDKGYDKGPEFLSDHPSLKSRVDASKKRAAALPPNAEQWRRDPVAGKARFDELQARSVQVGKTLPSDQTLEAQKLLSALPRSCLTPSVRPDQQEAERRVLIEQKQREQNAAQRSRGRR